MKSKRGTASLPLPHPDCDGDGKASHLHAQHHEAVTTRQAAWDLHGAQLLAAQVSENGAELRDRECADRASILILQLRQLTYCR